MFEQLKIDEVLQKYKNCRVLSVGSMGNTVRDSSLKVYVCLNGSFESYIEQDLNFLANTDSEVSSRCLFKVFFQKKRGIIFVRFKSIKNSCCLYSGNTITCVRQKWTENALFIGGDPGHQEQRE